MRCPMCKTVWDESQQASACGHCPLYRLNRGCRLKLLRCPACGYHSLRSECLHSSPTTSPVAPAQGSVSSLTLEGLRVGQRARLVGYDGISEHELQRLAAYGLVPGVQLTVLQRKPAVILRFHQTELAVEPALAKAMYVSALA